MATFVKLNELDKAQLALSWQLSLSKEWIVYLLLALRFEN